MAMVADSLTRQFLLKYRHLIRVSTIEDDLGITGKSIHKWLTGKRPLPEKWEKPLQEYLYPLFDPKNKRVIRELVCDKVVTVESKNILPSFKNLEREMLQKHHFNPMLTSSADVVYFRFVNSHGKEGYLSIYSRYMANK